MRKQVVVIALLLIGCSSFAQFSGNLKYSRSYSVNSLGADFIYLFGSEGLKIGPSVGVSKALISNSSLAIDYGLQMRYFFSGSIDDGGFYPEVDLLGVRNGSNSYMAGFGLGYKVDTGTDLAFRWETGINPSGGNGITFRVGMFF